MQFVSSVLKAPRPTDHISPHLRTLHWLPIDARINTNVSSLCLGAALTSSGPVYLSDLLKIYTPSRQLASIFHRQPYTVHAVCQQSVVRRMFFLLHWTHFRKKLDSNLSVSLFLLKLTFSNILSVNNQSYGECFFSLTLGPTSERN